MKYRAWVLILPMLLLLCSCGSNNTKLRFGIIEPSINHLPLSYGIAKGLIPSENIDIVRFTSGWEANEALIHNKIDMAILPFTFIWSDVSKGYSVKRLSSFERESDGIISQKNITNISQLENQKVGVLRASILDVLMRKLATRNQLQYTPVYFRSPSEMVAALQANQVAAIVLYVPLLEILEDKYNILYYFKQDSPRHPCCDLAVNTNSYLHLKKQMEQLKNNLADVIIKTQEPAADYIDFVGTRYKLSQKQSYDALNHVIFDMQTIPTDLIFEFEIAQEMMYMKYLEEVPSLPQVVMENNQP